MQGQETAEPMTDGQRAHLLHLADQLRLDQNDTQKRIDGMTRSEARAFLADLQTSWKQENEGKTPAQMQSDRSKRTDYKQRSQVVRGANTLLITGEQQTQLLQMAERIGLGRMEFLREIGGISQAEARRRIAEMQVTLEQRTKSGRRYNRPTQASGGGTRGKR
jgi:hypothetical protein